MTTDEKINLLIENQKALAKEIGLIEELLKALLMNNVLDSAESTIKNSSESAKKDAELRKLRTECESLRKSNSENSSLLTKLKSESNKKEKEIKELHDKIRILQRYEELFRSKVGKSHVSIYSGDRCFDIANKCSIQVKQKHTYNLKIVDYENDMYKMWHTPSNTYFWTPVDNVIF